MTKMNHYLTVTFFCCIAIALNASPQHSRQSFNPGPISAHIVFHGGLAMPMGDFGKSFTDIPIIETNIGFAKTGFELGGRLQFSFGSGLFGWIFDATLIMNSFDDQGFEEVFRDQWHIGNGLTLIVDPKNWWINVPMLTGPCITIDLSSRLSVYGIGLIGVSLCRAPDVTVSGDGGSFAQYEYELTPTLGTGVETGLLIDNFSFGARFSFLSSDNVKGTAHYNLGGLTWSDEYEKDFSVAIFQLTCGVHF